MEHLIKSNIKNASTNLRDKLYFLDKLVARFYLTKQLVFIILTSLVASASIYAAPRSAYDYDGDGEEEVVLWESNSSNFSFINRDGSSTIQHCGLPGDIPLTGNVVTGGRAEAIVWRPGLAATFYICAKDKEPTTVNLGTAGDIPLSTEDFDGDGMADLSVWRQTGEWIELLSTGRSNGAVSVILGQSGDIPVPGDYDGNGLSQEAVFRPKTGAWIILQANKRDTTIKPWGFPSDIPVPADYDGDKITDIAVWRPSDGNWYIIPSGNPNSPIIVKLGEPGDIPMPREMTGDTRVDFVIFRPSSGDLIFKASSPNQNATTETSFLLTDQFAQGSNTSRIKRSLNDFDGDGKTDFTVIRKIDNKLHWLSKMSSRIATRNFQFGIVKDLSVPGDYNGDGKTDFAVVRTKEGALTWLIQPNGNTAAYSFDFGLPGDIAFAGKFDLDQKVDPTVVRQVSGEMLWYILSSLSAQNINFKWGKSGDKVVIGDFNGDGIGDPTFIRRVGNSLFWFTKRLDGLQLPGLQWGSVGDIPVPADYDGDGSTDYAILRESNGIFSLYIRTSSGNVFSPIQWGLKGDAFLAGNYSGSLTLEATAWRYNRIAGKFIINRPSNPAYSVAFGRKGDTLIGLPTPRTTRKFISNTAPNQGTTPASNDPINNSTLKSICDDFLLSNDGSGGYEHRPASNLDGNLVIILNQKFTNTVVALALFSGNTQLESLSFSGLLDSRVVFRASKAGKAYPKNLIERITTKDGRKHCIIIKDPALAYD